MVLMDHMQEIAEVERRARELNLTVWELCRRADVHYALWYRWRGGESVPILRTWNATFPKMTATLEREEARLMAAIKQRGAA